MIKRFISHSPAETEEAGAWLASRLLKGDLVAFSGGMGMGKTVFTRGMVRGLGITADVSSPTFTLINEYISPSCRVAHMDAYRLSGADDLESTGFYDYLDGEWILVVEWSEQVSLPSPAVRVAIHRLDDNTREIVMEGKRI